MATQRKSAPQRKKRGSYHHGNLREALLEAAVKRIGESQDFDFRLRDLAEDCGVRLAACYRHFPAKRDVLVELARRGFVGLREALVAVDDTLEPTEALARLGSAYIGFAQANPVPYLAMFHPTLAQRAPYPALAASAVQTLQPLQAAVARLFGLADLGEARVAEGVFRAWAGVHGYASLLISQESDAPRFASPEASDSVHAYTRAIALSIMQARS